MCKVNRKVPYSTFTMPKSLKKLKSNRAWIERHINDPFVKKSRAEGYRARSAYKLIELDEKEKILRPGITVVDLGAAPGSWSQVARAKLTNPDGTFNGRVVSMDILPMEPIEGVDFLQGDFREESVGRDGGRRSEPVSVRTRARFCGAAFDPGRHFCREGIPGIGLLAVHRSLQKGL